MAETMEQILARLNATYDPQKQLIAQQQAALPGQQAADVAGLDAAKANAFGDITRQANDRGVVYSGAPIAEQSRYVGERYLPALAGVKNDYANRGFKLQEALLGVNQNQRGEAEGIFRGQQKAEADAQYKAEQLALERERMANTLRAAQTRSSTPKAPSASERQAAFNDKLAQYFEGYDPKNKSQNFFTEKAVIPQLISDFGLDPTTVAKQVYAYRKARFGE